jgi:hypothetical protein
MDRIERPQALRRKGKGSEVQGMRGKERYRDSLRVGGREGEGSDWIARGTEEGEEKCCNR